MNNTSSLRPQEKAQLVLGELYTDFGYTRFKMCNFEKYDLYGKNKEFLQSERMITFTDAGGALYALKPDVTLSIIKNTPQTDGVRKVFYHESVYRPLKGEGNFREIMQSGLECIGKLDFYHVCEVITLAVMSLKRLSERCVLDLSNLALVSGIIENAGLKGSKQQVLQMLGEKNISAIRALPVTDEKYRDALVLLCLSCGDIDSVITALEPYCKAPAMRRYLQEFSIIGSVLRRCGIYENVRIDFSVVNDMAYYNGIVFQGFIEGIASGVISGGQYDLLVKKMGKSMGAIGFAVNLDELEILEKKPDPYDTDVLLVYDTDVEEREIIRAVLDYSSFGERVRAVSADDGTIRCSRVIRLTREGRI